MAKPEDRCLLVLGMPGVGKSLLVTQLRSALRLQLIARRVLSRCSAS